MAYVILCRVSTEEQKNSGAGIDGQEDACRAFIERNPGEIRRILYEEDFSGGLPLHKRPILIEAIDLLQKGDILLVHKRDRLFRGDPFSNGMIEYEIRKRGATLRSVMGEGTEGDDPGQVFMRRVIDAASEYERNLIKYRTKTALQAKKRRGERVGEIPFGYRLACDSNRLEPQAKELESVQIMHSLRSRGFSLREIGQHLQSMGIHPPKSEQWSAMSIKRILARPLPPLTGSAWPADPSPAPLDPACVGG